MLHFLPFLKVGVWQFSFYQEKFLYLVIGWKYSLEGFLVYCKDFLWHLHVYCHSQGFYLSLVKKKALLNSPSVIKFYKKMVVIFERYDSKLVVPCGILAAKFVLVFTKKLSNFSAIDFLSVIVLVIVKLLGKNQFVLKIFQW